MHEAEGRKRRLAAGEQAGDILPEQLGIERIDMLQIYLAVRSGGEFLPVDVIVIQTHQDGLFAVHPKLDGQAVGSGGFAGGAGAGQHDHLGGTLAYHIRDLRNPLFMERLVDADQLPDAAGNRFLIQVGHRLAFHQRTPAFALGEDGEEIGAGLKFGSHVRVQIVRVEQNHAALCRKQIPDRQVAGGRKHLPKEIIRIILIDIFVEGILRAPLQQLRLIGLIVPPELVNGLLPGDPLTEDREILPDIGSDLLLQRLHRNAALLLDGNEDAAAQRAADFRGGIRPKRTDRHKHQEARRPGIHFFPRVLKIAQQMHLPIGGSHGTAHGGALLFLRSGTDGNIVQCENLTGNFGSQRSVLQMVGIHAQALNQLPQGLAGACLNGDTIDLQLHIYTSARSVLEDSNIKI